MIGLMLKASIRALNKGIKTNISTHVYNHTSIRQYEVLTALRGVVEVVEEEAQENKAINGGGSETRCLAVFCIRHKNATSQPC